MHQDLAESKIIWMKHNHDEYFITMIIILSWICSKATFIRIVAVWINMFRSMSWLRLWHSWCDMDCISINYMMHLANYIIHGSTSVNDTCTTERELDLPGQSPSVVNGRHRLFTMENDNSLQWPFTTIVNGAVRFITTIVNSRSR
jgi:hypothetical protein